MPPSRIMSEWIVAISRCSLIRRMMFIADNDR